jgi:hypothetical protein
MLTEDEHARMATEFLEKADRHYAEGDQIQASEKLWGAAAHVIMSLSLKRGWPHTSHPAMKRAAERLSEEHNDPLVAAEFGVAEKYHRDFYHLFMEDEEWSTDRPKVQDLVSRVLALRGDIGRNGQAASSS